MIGSAPDSERVFRSNTMSVNMCRFALLVFMLGGCAYSVAADDDSPKQLDGQAHAESHKSSAGRKVARSAPQALINSLLSDADDALAAKRLLLPEHDNAVDKYRAVLMLEPNNARAQAGVDAVVLAYAELVRHHLKQARFRIAERLINRIERNFPNNHLIAILHKEHVNALELAEPKKLDFVVDTEKQYYELPKRALSRKTKQVKTFLSEIAKRVKNSNEAVLIFARSDAEGRWIYKTMKDSITGYRIRGDIRRAKKPAIQLESPL